MSSCWLYPAPRIACAKNCVAESPKIASFNCLKPAKSFLRFFFSSLNVIFVPENILLIHQCREKRCHRSYGTIGGDLDLLHNVFSICSIIILATSRILLRALHPRTWMAFDASPRLTIISDGRISVESPRNRGGRSQLLT